MEREVKVKLEDRAVRLCPVRGERLAGGGGIAVTVIPRLPGVSMEDLEEIVSELYGKRYVGQEIPAEWIAALHETADQVFQGEQA